MILKNFSKIDFFPKFDNNSMPFNTIFFIRINSTKLDLSKMLNQIEKRDIAIC